METSKLFFDLPKHLIAQFPQQRREQARLVRVLSDSIRFEKIISLPHCIPHNSCVVINTSRVRHARIYAEGVKGGNRVEFLLLTRTNAQQWRVLSRKAKSGEEYVLQGGIRVQYTHPYIVSEEALNEEYIHHYGSVPLPPYIHRRAAAIDSSRYQTIYADSLGSSAAPTAGLHLSEHFFEQCALKRITIVPVLLHVGLGTFNPIKKDSVEDHEIHEEEYNISEESAAILNTAKRKRHNILVVGTTSLRVVESASDAQGRVRAGLHKTRLYITPGYRCKVATAMLTNFHTPYSSLLVLVSSLIGYNRTMDIYARAIQRGIRFFSYGDAMYIETFSSRSS